MKRNLKTLLIAALLVTAPMLMLAQTPPHPNGGNAPSSGNGNTPVGQAPSAPIGGGTEILVALGIAYAISRYRVEKKAE
jgi:hypothetical protein